MVHPGWASSLLSNRVEASAQHPDTLGVPTSGEQGPSSQINSHRRVTTYPKTLESVGPAV